MKPIPVAALLALLVLALLIWRLCREPKRSIHLIVFCLGWCVVAGILWFPPWLLDGIQWERRNVFYNGQWVIDTPQKDEFGGTLIEQPCVLRIDSDEVLKEILMLMTGLGLVHLFVICTQCLRQPGEFRRLILPLRENGIVVLGISLVLAAVIYAFATRYVHAGQGRVLDKWTGEVQRR